MKTVGQVAFEKWVSLVPTPGIRDWHQLPQTGQEGWEAIASEVIQQFTDGEARLVHDA